jgi:CBS domain-containing protein
MNAGDVMTKAVVSVHPDTSAREIARLLLDNGISAVPVVDSNGAPIGMVSEGDLIGRDDAAREARRDWWLTLLAEGEALNTEFVASLRAPERTARDIMSTPVVTVGEDTEVGEIARLLAAYRVKRVPVVRDGRANLLRALADQPPKPAVPEASAQGSGFLAWVDQHYLHGHRQDHNDRHAEPPASREDADLRVEDFRELVADFQRGEARHREEARRAATEQRQHKLRELIDHHISDESWRAILQNARQAAVHGQKELMLLRFPSQLTSDRGRAINVMEPGWPGTLRGEAAEFYLRWERDLKPHGFHLTARVLDFPEGLPGDIGLFLIWGE